LIGDDLESVPLISNSSLKSDFYRIDSSEALSLFKMIVIAYPS